MSRAASFETFARLGFAARGLIYLAIAYLAIRGGQNAGSSDVLKSMADGGGGRLVLFVIALGLLAYGAWRCLDAAQDLEGEGDGPKGLGARLGKALSGVGHVVLGLLAAALALGLMHQGGGGNEGSDKAAGWVMDLPAGGFLLQLTAIGFMLGGLLQGWSAYRLRFLKQLEPRAASRAWVKWSGRLGYAARGVVFFLIGVLLWRAAGNHDPEQAGGMGEALASLSRSNRLILAAGLGLFGVFNLVQALYRRITNPHVLSRLRMAR